MPFVMAQRHQRLFRGIPHPEANLGNFLQRLALPKLVKKWSLRTLREELIKIGAKVVKHSRYVVFQMAEVVVPRTLFREILERISRLRANP